MIVLFEEDEPRLLLTDVKRDYRGKIQFADVVNGAWRLEIRGDESLAKSGNYIVNRWSTPDYYEMEIPDKVKGDYNAVMEWARKEYKRINR